MGLGSFINKGLPANEAEVAEYIDAWQRLLDSPGADGKWPPQRREGGDHALQRAMFDHFYANLSTLDAKAGSLLQISGLMVATYSIIPNINPLPLPAIVILSCGALCVGVATLLAVRIIWVHWSSIGELESPEAHIRTLLRVRDSRTRLYRRAWVLALASLAFLAVLVCVDGLDKLAPVLAPIEWACAIVTLMAAAFVFYVCFEDR